MKKKILAACLAALMVSSCLTACGSGKSEGKKGSSDETYTVTMAYVGDKKEDTERIEGKINEIIKKTLIWKSIWNRSVGALRQKQ